MPSQHAKFATWPTQCSGTHEELPLVSWSYCMLIAEEETESAGKIEKFERNLISVEIPPLDREIRVYQHEKVGEKVGENRG